jgi:HSP20 family molecular chaperone IbpA
MIKKKEKKIVVQTGKQQQPQAQKTLLPVLENPFEIFDDINRMYYGDPWIKPWWNRWMMNQSLGVSPESRMRLIPVDIVDTGKTYQIITEMPGIDKRDIEITITSKTISICGVTETKIRNETKGYIKKERGYSTLCRYLRFPEDVNPDNAEAILNDGILQINVHKKTPSEKSNRVPVK